MHIAILDTVRRQVAHLARRVCLQIGYWLGYTDKTLDTVVFHTLEPMTLVILYIKFNQMVGQRISCYVAMLTWICQSQILKSSSSLNSSSGKSISPAGTEREL